MTRVNERIRAPRVRVVSGKGEQLGVMDTREAVQRAKAIGLDLVEVASKADPPVCRVVDYGKWKYEQSKLKKTSKSKSVTRLKEIKFRVRTELHDYNIKLGRIEAFLEEGHKVRAQLQFRGRENAHREIGFEKMERIKGDIKGMANVDQEPKLVGRNVVMVLSPLPASQQVRKFKLSHGDLIEEDDFEEDADLGDEHDEAEGAEGAEEKAEEKAEE
ncbi:MAG: translation initiation factor IF-3 [Roseibacillus sp.]|nr:translation initiation factor IF-3 [Roseibacillus sp.]MDP7655027.1 translation initiation factor IF-3 [Roseibacillus sp.]